MLSFAQPTAILLSYSFFLCSDRLRNFLGKIRIRIRIQIWNCSSRMSNELLWNAFDPTCLSFREHQSTGSLEGANKVVLLRSIFRNGWKKPDFKWKRCVFDLIKKSVIHMMYCSKDKWVFGEKKTDIFLDRKIWVIYLIRSLWKLGSPVLRVP